MNTMFDVIGLYSFHYNFKYRIYATIMQLVLGEKNQNAWLTIDDIEFFIAHIVW